MDDSSGDFLCPDNETLIKELCPLMNSTASCSNHASSPSTLLGTLAVLGALFILIAIIAAVGDGNRALRQHDELVTKLFETEMLPANEIKDNPYSTEKLVD